MSSAAGRPPSLSPEAVCKLVSKYFNVRNIVEDSVKALPSYDDVNYYLRGEAVDDSQCTEFVLKVANPVYTSFPVIEGLNKLMCHVSSSGFKFATSCPIISRAGTDIISLTVEQMGLDGSSEASTNSNCNSANMTYPVRLLPFIPGEVFDAVDKQYLTPAVLSEVGETLAMIDKELKENFSNETLASRENPYWDLIAFPNVKQFLDDVDDPVRRSNAEIVFKYFEDCVMPKIPSFDRGIIHGDFNGLNIIMDKEQGSNAYHVTGVIDFGDSSENYMIIELGICLAYLMMENTSPRHFSSTIEFVGPVIQGYCAILPLTPDEFDSLYYLALARCVQSAVMGTHAFKAEPWNTYLLTTPEKAWTIIDLLLSTTKEVVDGIWKKYFCKDIK